MKRLQFTILCASLLSLAGAGYSAPLTFTGTLSGANENPPTGSAGTGSAVVTFDPVTGLLGISVNFSGLGSGTTASHIHCCVLPNGNAGVATTVPTFPSFPLGVTSGTYSQTLDMGLSASYNPAFITANGGTVALAEAALSAGLSSGMAYLNIHTTNFGGGEVRAFLVPTPEPISAILVLSALGAFSLRRRFRK